DLDPRTADLLLALLRDRGVAAYAATSPDPDPLVTDGVDRLYVDVAAVEQARALIDDELAEPADGPGDLVAGSAGEWGAGTAEGSTWFDDDRAVDAEFASIVAGFHSAPTTGAPPWPAGEDVER